MRRILGCALVVALFASALLAPNAGAKVRYPFLDPSFGSGGYVSLSGELPGPTNESVRLEYLGSARGGAVYASETALVGGTCGATKCVYRGFLARVNSDGTVASTFGGSGRVEVGGSIERLSPPIADAEGRALVVSTDGPNATVHRYLADGSVDTSFGSGGTTSFDIGSGTAGSRQIQLAVDGEDRIVVSVNTLATSGTPTAEALARLLPNGAMDAGFGSGGVLQLGAVSQPFGIAFGTNNAVYTWGSSGFPRVAYLHRVSAKGRIDTTFDAAADKTLANVGARGTVNYGSGVLVVRPHGLLDLYGGDGLLRLRSDGKAETKFGEAGVKQLGWSIIAATLVGNGKILGLGRSSEGVSLIRLQSNGKPDRSFGTEGARLIEGVEEEEGLSLAWLNGRRAQVLDLGQSFCRTGCNNSKITLVRYRIGPKQG